MKKIYPHLFIGDLSDCLGGKKEDFAIIHACKIPCHRNKLGYSSVLSQTHPNYLIYEKDKHLYLNLLDMNKILTKFADPIFFTALDFIDKHIADRNVLIHCNQGLSHSPSIGLAYMARIGAIDNTSLDVAFEDFKTHYPKYNPKIGVYFYLKENWQKLMEGTY